MSKRMNFGYLEQVEDTDLDNIGLFAQQDNAKLIRRAISNIRAYAGLDVTAEPNNTSVRIATGEVFETDGQMYSLEVASVVPLAPYMPIAGQRVRVALVAWGQTVETEVRPRTFAVDVDSEVGEPREFATVFMNTLNVEALESLESIDPQLPLIPNNAVHFATVTLGPTGITDIAMVENTRLVSVIQNSAAITDIIVRLNGVEPAVTGLKGDLAALNSRTANVVDRSEVINLMGDVARLKEKADLPDDYAQYGSDFFADDTETDTAFSAATMQIEDGLLFPTAAENTFTLDLFNVNDPNVKKFSNGLVLPSHTEKTLWTAPAMNGNVSLSQYEVTSHTIKTQTVVRTIRRWGWKHNWYYPFYFRYKYGYYVKYWHYHSKWNRPKWWGRVYFRPHKHYWYETITDVTTSIVRTSTVVNGILSAQTWAAPRSGWFLGFNMLFTTIDSTGPVDFLLCETQLGQPLMDQTMSRVTIPVADLKLYPTKTRVPMPPVMLEAGKRYSMVAITQGNHRVATVDGNNFRDGTYFAGTDGAYFQGDLLKDIWLEVLVASFTRPRTEAILQTVDLVGGISDISIETEEVVPEGNDLDFQVSVGGDWKSLETQDITGLPNTAPLRAVFVGTVDLQPGFYTGANRITVSRPATAVHHRSLPYVLGAPADSFQVDWIVHKYDPALHDMTPKLRVAGTPYDPDVSEEILENEEAGLYRLRHTWLLGATTTSIVLDTIGTRDPTTAPFVVLQRTHAVWNRP